MNADAKGCVYVLICVCVVLFIGALQKDSKEAKAQLFLMSLIEESRTKIDKVQRQLQRIQTSADNIVQASSLLPSSSSLVDIRLNAETISREAKDAEKLIRETSETLNIELYRNPD